MATELGVGCKLLSPYSFAYAFNTPPHRREYTTNTIPSFRCVGTHLANRELYTAFLRCIVAFEILPPQKASDQPVLDCFGCNALPNGLTMDPKPFKVGLKVRDREALDGWIEGSEERTRDV